MSFSALLFANRGAIAVRIARARADLGPRSVAAFFEDDAEGHQVRLADQAHPLPGRAPAPISMPRR